MNIGLLWYDPNPDLDLARKVARAAARYAQKYGRGAPDTCYVHPSALAGMDGETRVGCVLVLPRRETARDNFWVGREE